jgi:hypothetical protein
MKPAAADVGSVISDHHSELYGRVRVAIDAAVHAPSTPTSPSARPVPHAGSRGCPAPPRALADEHAAGYVGKFGEAASAIGPPV